MYMIDEVRVQQEYSYNKIRQNNSYKVLKRKYEKRITNLDDFLSSLIYHCRSSATSRDLKFKIGSNYVYELYKQQNGLCALSGIQMTYVKAKDTRISNLNISIDRIDSSKGYLQNNIQLVCASINIMKLDHSNKEFIELCKAVAKHNNLC